MVDCTADLQSLEANVTDCKYHISSENDPDNWWYSPFDDTGLGVGASGSSYRLQSGGPGNTYSRGSAEFNAFSNTPGIQCSAEAGVNWTNADAGKCIDVDATDQSKLADTQSSELLPQSQCNGTNQRWISEPTPFAPAGVVSPGQHTNYEIKGCVGDCESPDLTAMHMTEVNGGDKGFKSFNQNIKCQDGFHPPAVHNGTRVTNPEPFLSAAGVAVQGCTTGGTPYTIDEGCSANCVIAPDGPTNEGYDIAGWVTRINASPTAKAKLGATHWGDGNAIGSLLQCRDGYTRTTDNTFLTGCSASGQNVSLNDDMNSDAGCIADCIADPNSIPYEYDASGSLVSGSLPVADGDASGPLPTMPYLQGQGNVSFTCPTGYEPGPGATSSTGVDGQLAHSTPTYQHCGKLQGNISPQAYSDLTTWSDDGFLETRKNYAVTGCYPVCNRDTEICLNYTSESDYDPRSYQQDAAVAPGATEDTWRTEMGEAFTAASPILGLNNISYVRRQVLNNKPVADTMQGSFRSGKEIYEWQFKCLKTECSMNSEPGKVDLLTLLGPDGIPNPIAHTYTRTDGAYCGPGADSGNINTGPHDGETLDEAKARCDASAAVGGVECVAITEYPPMPLQDGSMSTPQYMMRSTAECFPSQNNCANGAVTYPGYTCHQKQASPVAPQTDPVTTAQSSWHVGQGSEETCNDTCAASGGLVCTDEDWGVTADASSWNVPGIVDAVSNISQTCVNYQDGSPSPGPFLVKDFIAGGPAGEAWCYGATTPAVCNETLGVYDNDYVRLCKCEVPR